VGPQKRLTCARDLSIVCIFVAVVVVVAEKGRKTRARGLCALGGAVVLE
jgi:hypothetical protein